MGGFDPRKRRALAQLDAVIDVLSAWQNRHADDDRQANFGWICAVIGTTGEKCGWLHDKSDQPVFGWAFEGNALRFHSIVRPTRWPITRREFRQLATDCGVSLPSRHATIYLDDAAKAKAQDEDYARWLKDRRRYMAMAATEGEAYRMWVEDQNHKGSVITPA